MAKKYPNKIAAAIFIFLAICMISSLNSFNIAVLLAGYSPAEIHIIYRGYDDYRDSELTVLSASSKKHSMTLFMMEKKFGFWYAYLETAKLDYANFNSLSWVGKGVWKGYLGEPAEFFDGLANEWHFVYCGDKAMKLIDIPNEMIPHNVTVSIQQIDNEYWIHFITYDDDMINGINDILHYLPEEGYLEF